MLHLITSAPVSVQDVLETETPPFLPQGGCRLALWDVDGCWEELGGGPKLAT